MSGNIELTRGDTKLYKMQRKDADSKVIKEKADAVYFTVKDRPNGKVVLQKTLDDMSFDDEGYYHFIISSEDTDKILFGTYVYDVEIIVDGVKHTPASGDFIINIEITSVEDEK